MRHSYSSPYLVLGVLLGSTFSGCASAPVEDEAAHMTSAETLASEPAAQPAEPSPVPIAPAPPPASTPSPEGDSSVIVIDAPEPPEVNDLVAASRAAKEQRERNPATTKITNKNLKDYSGGLVTTAAPRTPPIPDAEAATVSREEQMWRERVLDLRMRARRSRDEIHRLEGEVAGLRRSFYVEDDPYVRDSRVKPAWDRALDNLNVARREAESLQRELARVLDEGRQAGALPGWLREGLELENDLPPADSSGHHPIEPPVAPEPVEPIPPP